MGKGINNITALNMHGKDWEGSRRELLRWAKSLPFGAVGFHMLAVNNQVVGAGTAADLLFDTVYNAVINKGRNFEGWKPDAATSSFVVPKGLSGIYALSAGEYHAAGIAGIAFSIDVNGTAIVSDPTGATATVFHTCSGFSLLNEGDTIKVRIANTTGAPITSTFFGGDALTPIMPFFQAWRISLL